ncbi:MAG: hypothetical protein OEV78_03730 [Spirochaetia bacterium]|nr:hypothetical protein [Spirochaetia bacterium]
MIYLTATFIGLLFMSMSLFIAAKAGKKKIAGSCSTITSNGKKEVYCDTCSTTVKDKCLKN